MKTLLAASCIAGLAIGCIKDPTPPELINAIPTKDQVSIKLPQNQAREAPTIGQVADMYKLTRGVTTMFNGGTAWVLILVHTIVQYPVTSVNGKVYTWGPWHGDALDPGIYKLDVTANADGTYHYVLSGHNRADATATFLPLIDGLADPRPGENRGKGSFLLDFDAGRTVDPVANASNKGKIDVHYDLAAAHIDLTVMSTDAQGHPVNATYAYQASVDGGGNMTFSIVDNFGSAQQASIAIRSRWTGAGAGRGDAKITGGSLGTQQAIASECWDMLFQRVFYTDNMNLQATEGNAASCAFTSAQLP
jgi:hypothetical protein